MSKPKFSLTVLHDLFAVCKLDAGDNIPSWALSGRFCSVTRTPDELSIVCPQELVPEGVEAVVGWKSLKVKGKLDFASIGVLSSLTSTLTEVRISIFAISTYDTDYLFIKDGDLNRGVAALQNAGHDVR